MMVVTSVMPPPISKWLKIKNQAEISMSAKPTTFRPMTAPERNATVSPSLSDCFAAQVVRAEALVAIFMPNQPHRPEKSPATGTPIKVNEDWRPIEYIIPRKTISRTKTIATTLY